jgi:hypothetical protein
MKIRKIVHYVEQQRREQDRDLPRSIQRCIVAAVLKNSLASTFTEDLGALHELGERLGRELTEVGLRAMGIAGVQVQSYGKAAIVGMDCELEHAAAILHPRFGVAVRSCLGSASAIMPSTVKRAAAGASLDVPLHNVLDMWSFDHFDGVSFSIADAPSSDELVIALGLADGGRPLARTYRKTINALDEALKERN